MQSQKRRATLVLSRHPGNHLEVGPGDLVVAASAVAARQYGAPPQTFDDVARRILERARYTVASDGEVMRTVAVVLEEMGITLDPMGLAGVLQPVVNLLYRSGADLRKLEEAGERPAFVGRVAIETRSRLDRLMLVAAADAITRAVECDIPRVPLCVLGFPRLNRMDLVLADRLAGPGSHIHLPFIEGNKLFEEAGFAIRYLTERGWDVQYPEDLPRSVGHLAADRFLRVPHTPCAVQARSYPTLSAEVRGVLREIKAGIAEGRFKADEAVIVTRSEPTYGPMVIEIAYEYGIPIRMQYAATVFDTRFGQWLNALLEVCLAGEYPFEATARLVHHPLSARLRGENWSEARWNEARALHARGRHEWQSLGIETDVMLNQESATRREWYALMLDFVHKLEVGKLAGARAQDADAYTRLMDVLAELSLPTDEVIERKLYFAQIRDAMRATSILAFPGNVGVDFHTPLSIWGATAPHIFVLGAGEGMLPQSARDNSYVDYHERARLAELGFVELETAALAVRREALSFYQMLLSAEKSLTFTYPRLIGTNEVLPSPYLDRLGAAVEHRSDAEPIVASESEYLAAMLCESEGSSVYAQRALRAWSTTLHREAGGPLNLHTGNIGIPFAWERHVFSAHQITTFGQCPYRWFGAHLLKIIEAEEADDDLAPATKGRLFHEVLSRSIRAARGAQDVRQAILERLEREFDAVAHGDTWAMRAAGWHARRPELLAQLRRAVEGPDFLIEGARPERTEVDFEGMWNGLRVRGRIDRIDRIGDDRYIVDYKTSSVRPSGVKDATGKLKLDVQLPIYMAVTPNAVGGYYYSLSNAGNLIAYSLPGSRPRTPDEEGLAQLSEKLKDHLAAGRYAVAPDDAMQACAYCEMDLVCRRGPHLQRKPEPAE